MKKYIQSVRENLSLYYMTGVESAELQDLLAVIIGNKATPELTGKLAARGIAELVEMSTQELENEGLTPLKALELHSSFLLAKKLLKVDKKEQRFTIRSPQDAADFLMGELVNLNQEHFVSLFLNTKNEVICKKTLFVGTLNSSIVHPRDLFREAVKQSAASIIICHNHPSGNATPSPEDIEVTKRIVEAGHLMGIDLLDHIILGDHTHISLKELGYM